MNEEIAEKAEEEEEIGEKAEAKEEPKEIEAEAEMIEQVKDKEAIETIDKFFALRKKSEAELSV